MVQCDGVDQGFAKVQWRRDASLVMQKFVIVRWLIDKCWKDGVVVWLGSVVMR